MDKMDQKLIDDVCALLREAGCGGVEAHRDSTGAMVSATRGRGGVMFRLATDVGKVAQRTEGGAAEPQTRELDVGAVPELAGAAEQVRANPELAKALNIPAGHMKLIM